MAHFLPSGYRVCWVDAGSRYKVDRWTIICPGLSENNKRKKSDRAHSQLAVFVKTVRNVFGKKCDKQLTHIVRVRYRAILDFQLMKLSRQYRTFGNLVFFDSIRLSSKIS